MKHELNPLATLPVFQLCGGSDGLRRQCVQWLRSAFSQHSLRGLFFLAEKPVSLLQLSRDAKKYDIIILACGGDYPVRKIILHNNKKERAVMGELLTFYPGYEEEFMVELTACLDDIVRRRPVWACLLMGGKSSRMGRPKHLISGQDGKTWLEKSVEVLRPHVDGVVLVGGGLIPQELATVQCLPDVPGVVGPLTGILAAMRWQPLVSWLVVACDMPRITAGAVEWLLEGRCAGQWGRVPRLAGARHCEPLFAWYDIHASRLFEGQAFEGNLRPGRVASHEKISNPEIPSHLRLAWENINTPQQLATVQRM